MLSAHEQNEKWSERGHSNKPKRPLIKGAWIFASVSDSEWKNRVKNKCGASEQQLVRNCFGVDSKKKPSIL